LAAVSLAQVRTGPGHICGGSGAQFSTDNAAHYEVRPLHSNFLRIAAHITSG